MARGISQRWLVYALGGGLGHVHRGLAIARCAASRGHAVDLLVNSPWMHLVKSAPAFTEGVSLSIIPATCPREGVIARVKSQLQISYDVVVVDTFPRGLAGELAPHLSDGRRWAFVHRDLTETYAYRPEVQVAVGAYSLRIAPGERGPLFVAESFVETDPIVLCDYGDLLTPEAAHRLLETSPDGPPVIAMVAAGRPEEGHVFDALSAELSKAPVQLRTIRTWPFAPLLSAVDAVVGTGGYQTVFECHLSQTPLFATALERLYDRQARRLDAVRALGLAAPTIKSINKRAPIRPFSTGAIRAVEAIESA